MPDAQGRIKGVALSGKASESWERIFGGGEPAGPLTEEGLLEAIEHVSSERYHPERETGAYQPLDFSGPWPRAKDWKPLEPTHVVFEGAVVNEDGSVTRMGVDPAPEGAGS